MAKRALCAYCGLNMGNTRDHVIPRGLFPRPLPQNMITVPACDACNQKYAQHEGYLRDILTSDFRTAKHTAAQEVLNGPVKRSAKANKSDFARALSVSKDKAPAYTKSGIYLGEYPAVLLDPSRIDLVFDKIIRGLYYHNFGKSVPSNYHVQTFHITDQKIMSIWANDLSAAEYNGPFDAGTVLRYLFLFIPDDEGSTVWFLRFYGHWCIVGFTFSPDVEA